MSVLLSNWSKHVRTVPSSYVLPQEKRPGNLISAPVCKSIPVIDLGQLGRLDRAGVLQQIMNACQDFGIFQVINHGVSEELMEDTMSLFKEFFDMPAEELAEYCSEDRTKSFRLYTSGMNHKKDDVNLWKDWVSHLCHPLEDYVQSWPEKPVRYREVVGHMQWNSTGGAWASDLQGWQWAGVEPLPHAFVINICNQLEVINHEVLQSLKDGTMSLFEEFFPHACRGQASFYTEDRYKSCKLYTSDSESLLRRFITGKIHFNTTVTFRGKH
ncbi:2-oxoglutarate (2OG) and Fe(II)-dependent oxygenase superfamily protein [Actinidia rufa]|uniref:2-oxoglutarate (2OG) and Fe(II)-dependent oxygenase superfamily protein n=1 Tax=Actinidia rufa TaxID=165716 RepID=A0A7J0GRX7_9ERIC|nr:2-oxoglutarate (2OG) and Fe(II)-dependent oxygenase superfamily protein [Actinidia rufa]